jgi:hypothetical protein
MTDKVKIGRKTYTIHLKGRLKENALGWCIYAGKNDTGRIEIKARQGDIADTIIHEVLHAICDDQKLNLAHEEEERIVSALANGLTRFLRDNPEYRDKLMGLL